MKPGYKQTEVGVIPEDWEVSPLRSVLTKGRLGGNYPNQDRETEFPLMKMGNLARGKMVTSKVEYITQGVRPEAQHKLTKGDVLFNTRNTLDLVGKVAIWRDELPLAYYNSNLMRLEFDPRQVCSNEYANAALNTSGALTILRGLATGTTSVAAIYTRDLLEMLFITPPLPEQRAIAAALSDVDGLLGALDRLIAKKRDLKQAAMQQLLTGQTRLPGFHGEWVVTTFGDVVRHHAGNSSLIKGRLSATDKTGLFRGYSASGQDVWCPHYEHDGFAIVVSAVGSRCGKAFTASGKWCAIANTHVVWPNASKVDSRFLSFFINDEDFWMKSGSGQPFVLFKQSFARPLKLPPLPEQAAIAEVLSEMDAELASLEQRREKTRALKQGMMQELLTGRTRLVSKATLEVKP
jgi:type I restriction enzyme S subunit